MIASTIALRYSIPSDSDGEFISSSYTFFQTTYVSIAVTLAITVALSEVSHLLIIRMNRKQAKDDAQKEAAQVSPTE